jgi:hypothetical protein
MKGLHFTSYFLAHFANASHLIKSCKKEFKRQNSKNKTQQVIINKHSNVFVKGYMFGLMSLKFKIVYYKDFLDNLDKHSKISKDLGIIKVAFIKE